MQNRIGSKILAIRQNHNLTQKVLAKKLGVSEGFIKDAELGKKILNESLINKLSKLFKEDMEDDYSNIEESFKDDEPTKQSPIKSLDKVNDVWNDAFSSVIKKVPVYNYSMLKPLDFIHMPVLSNKIEGYNSDKVMFLKIEDNNMLGMRINNGDIAFCFITSEIKNNGIYFLEHGNDRVTRQVKILDKDKILLISHEGRLYTETVNKKDIKILAKLLWTRIEF
ncbi:LexA family transcriptional regulator [Hathewaya histolytica]|uniref:XRE family transcriptional regulator n=1 Tax=Hathewaya histolytica TaxID=1498 RepID=A0A4U9RUW4_HATHI|nr:LexA family transcriptional regulator [Hathewaya histolytica]VTQ95571.1 XRE family transcriptional regulator [Hathewaya histolytica]